jgi:hypothetical protein
LNEADGLTGVGKYGNLWILNGFLAKAWDLDSQSENKTHGIDRPAFIITDLFRLFGIDLQSKTIVEFSPMRRAQVEDRMDHGFSNARFPYVSGCARSRGDP